MQLATGSELRLEALGHHTFRVSELRRGGMGVVAKLVGDQPDMLPMALKTYQEVADAERFEREARAWSALSGHPNIARLTWYGPWESGWATLGLWYPAGLADLNFPDDIARGFATLGEIAQGLLYAVEEQGVLHRDVKPGNILVDSSGRPRLTDFGLAAAAYAASSAASLNDLTGAMRSLVTVGGLSGTPLYMAPELFDGAPPSVSTELYAFGVTAYEFVTGTEHPYLGADTDFRFRPRFRGTPLANLPNAAGALKELLPSLVALDPSDRPASFAEVLKALGIERRAWQRSSLDIAKEAAVLLVQGRGPAAKELIEDALVERPGDPALLFTRVLALQEEGDATEVEASLEAACASVVASEGRLEGAVYIDPLVVAARGDIARGGLTQAASRLLQAVEWTSNADRRFYPEFGWLALREGRPQDAGQILRDTVGDFNETAMAYFAVAAARSDSRVNLAPEMASRFTAAMGSRRCAAAAALTATWLQPTRLSHAAPAIPAVWVRDLQAVLDVSGEIVPLDALREEALLGALELELVAGFNSADEAWARARSDRERTGNAFAVVAERFDQLFRQGTRLPDDLVPAVDGLIRVLGLRFDPGDPRARGLVSLVTAGYVWRLAEDPQRRGVASRWMEETVATSADPERPRYVSAGRAATQCLAQGVPLGLGSPGGLSFGRDIFDASFANAARIFVDPRLQIPDSDAFYAYCFGVALFEVEGRLDSLLPSSEH